MRLPSSLIPDPDSSFLFRKSPKRVAYVISALVIISVCFVGLKFWPSEIINILEPEPPTGDYGWVFNPETGELEYVQIPSTTFYHFANATPVNDTYNGIDISSLLIGNNTPIFTEGTYYGIGTTTFEPTIGVTKEGNLYMTSWGTGSGGATAIIKCTNMLTMTNASEYSCTDVGPPWVPNSNDPYLYVDLWTDALMKFDMHVLSGMTVEFSENEGASWRGPTAITWPYTLQDHQTIASSPYPCQQVLNCYDTTYVFCVNGNYPAPLCSTSFDGGLTWSPENEGAPSGCDSGGLTGHIIGSNNGNFYRGNPSCDGSGYSVYRSTNGGFTWTEHVLPTESTGTADTWNFEEVAVATDDEDNVHASWIGIDNLLYYSYSLDQGGSWSDPIMVAPPGVDGTGFVAIAAGSAGKVALGYIGTTNDADGNSTWNGYLTVMTDSFGQYPLITSTAVNAIDDPLDSQKDDCGYDRCGGFGDFIDIVIDESGRPWFGLSHNDAGDIGIFATTAEGPSLRGETVPLQLLPLGGPITL